MDALTLAKARITEAKAHSAMALMAIDCGQTLGALADIKLATEALTEAASLITNPHDADGQAEADRGASAD